MHTAIEFPAERLEGFQLLTESQPSPSFARFTGLDPAYCEESTTTAAFHEPCRSDSPCATIAALTMPLVRSWSPCLHGPNPLFMPAVIHLLGLPRIDPHHPQALLIRWVTCPETSQNHQG